MQGMVHFYRLDDYNYYIGLLCLNYQSRNILEESKKKEENSSSN
jgi:hypothetical protein